MSGRPNHNLGKRQGQFQPAGGQRITGDSMKILPEIKGKFDLLLTDPPYAITTAYAAFGQKKVEKRWSDTSIMETWFRCLLDLIKPLMNDTAVFVFFAGAPAVATWFPVLYEQSAFLQLATWDKGRIGPGCPLRNQCEYILVGGAAKGTEVYRRDACQPNIFRCPMVPLAVRKHPAGKPYELIRELVDFFCPPGGRVLDPFCGSNVVGRVCEELGREWVCIDWHEE